GGGAAGRGALPGGQRHLLARHHPHRRRAVPDRQSHLRDPRQAGGRGGEARGGPRLGAGRLGGGAGSGGGQSLLATLRHPPGGGGGGARRRGRGGGVGRRRGRIVFRRRPQRRVRKKAPAYKDARPGVPDPDRRHARGRGDLEAHRSRLHLFRDGLLAGGGAAEPATAQGQRPREAARGPPAGRARPDGHLEWFGCRSGEPSRTPVPLGSRHLLHVALTVSVCGCNRGCCCRRAMRLITCKNASALASMMSVLTPRPLITRPSYSASTWASPWASSPTVT